MEEKENDKFAPNKPTRAVKGMANGDPMGPAYVLEEKEEGIKPTNFVSLSINLTTKNVEWAVKSFHTKLPREWKAWLIETEKSQRVLVERRKVLAGFEYHVSFNTSDIEEISNDLFKLLQTSSREHKRMGG